jgi:uridylate kinase
MEQSVADYMGMLGTIMNALAVQEAVEKLGVPTRVMSAVAVQAVCETFIRRRALRHLEKRRLVVLAAGTGNPFFTTDTASVLRALELQCEAIIKATKVDGVYSSDPMRDPSARRYETLTFDDAIGKQLGVMDQTAFTMAREHSLPVIVLDIQQAGAIAAAARGEDVGTLVSCAGN